ncbi:uncharacterized protein PV07_05881 [Cladophialophora immunda]|uniref:Uncharacterized protein n=1 Tax=Cladophialophora immunda TaxID=569365 RepID=A0A0D2AXT7_9EURO|nr:uncharacterized protein PV07_05881 [Cladophialophora immunda]KIW30107.1 hypothetical protein PV07_05881 [Cladophialophora immunda]
MQILMQPFSLPGFLPPGYIQRTPAGEAPPTVEDALFDMLSFAQDTFGVDRRPAPMLEPQVILSQLQVLREARLRNSYGAEPDTPQRLWQEFQSVTEKVLGEYVIDAITPRDEDRQKARELRTIL